MKIFPFGIDLYVFELMLWLKQATVVFNLTSVQGDEVIQPYTYKLDSNNLFITMAHSAS